jgi:hypothetical protein
MHSIVLKIKTVQSLHSLFVRVTYASSLCFCLCGCAVVCLYQLFYLKCFIINQKRERELSKKHSLWYLDNNWFELKTNQQHHLITSEENELKRNFTLNIFGSHSKQNDSIESIMGIQCVCIGWLIVCSILRLKTYEIDWWLFIDYTLISWFIYSFIYLFIHSLIHWFIDSFDLFVVIVLINRGQTNVEIGICSFWFETHSVCKPHTLNTVNTLNTQTSFTIQIEIENTHTLDWENVIYWNAFVRIRIGEKNDSFEMGIGIVLSGSDHKLHLYFQVFFNSLVHYHSFSLLFISIAFFTLVYMLLNSIVL